MSNSGRRWCRAGARRIGVALAAGSVIAAAGCQSGGDAGEEGRRSALSATSTAVTFSLALPFGTSALQVALGATSSLQVSDRSRVVAQASGATLVTSTGASTTTIGVESKVPSIHSVPSVTLKDRSVVSGAVTTTGTVTRGAGVTVSGLIQSGATLTPFPRDTWSVTFPASGGDVTLEPGQTRTLAAGSYGKLTVKGGATVSLGSGTYFFRALDLQAQGVLKVTSVDVPTLVYLKDSITYRGKLVRSGLTDGFLVAYVGSASVVLESSFSGTFLAPIASVRFGVGGTPYTGAAFAKSILLDPEVTFTHRPFGFWNLVGGRECTGHGKIVGRGADGQFTCQCDPGWTAKDCSESTSVSAGTTPSLDAVMPAGPIRTAVKGYVKAVMASDNAAVESNALASLRGLPPAQVVSALESAFDLSTDHNQRWVLVHTAVALRNPAAIPFFTDLLRQPLPPGLVESQVDPHSHDDAAQVKILNRAVSGLVGLARQGNADSKTALIEAAGHPLRVVRSYVAFWAAQLGDAALISSVRARLPAADVGFLNLRKSKPSDLAITGSNPGENGGAASTKRGGVVIP